ncbi:LysR family transcriptional regulator [Sphingobium chlorophenolicum]|uniref:Putative LysR family transcriptional regulator n=1 Tax=Sphingobium chlorophenolicum TaxID=46429 RepID=A0A081RF16_SPHCR|nr:LysR substrate-binding domain-containing protein [Sphingobium chlorophenolicum]KEQ53789.1 putative LysR family transcriptional regulator [Sphingobium chlorophenolicum]
MVSRSTEVRHLQALSVLAQELHFGRAASRLHMTQPALSQLVRDLETKLGFRLVERTTRRVLLTGPGQTFLKDAEEILQHLDRAIETARTEAGQASNSIRIGAILPTAFGFLPEVLATFRHRYAGALIHIENRESQQLVTAVETGALHVALLRPPQNAGTLHVECLRREQFVVAMRTNHPLARIEVLRLRDLKEARIVRISRGDLREAFHEIDEQLEAAGLNIEPSQHADTTLTAMAFVSAGDGVSIVPSWTAGLTWKDVCFRQLNDLSASIDLSIAWEATNLPPIAEHFIEVARRTAA